MTRGWQANFGNCGKLLERPVKVGFEAGRARRWLAMLAFGRRRHKAEQTDGRIRL